MFTSRCVLGRRYIESVLIVYLSSSPHSCMLRATIDSSDNVLEMHSLYKYVHSFQTHEEIIEALKCKPNCLGSREMRSP